MNTTPETIARSYRAEPHALFGACLTALGTMQARIERHDIERGLIVARAGQGWLAPASEITLRISPAGTGSAHLSASMRPLRRGGDPRFLPALLQLIDGMLLV